MKSCKQLPKLNWQLFSKLLTPLAALLLKILLAAILQQFLQEQHGLVLLFTNHWLTAFKKLGIVFQGRIR